MIIHIIHKYIISSSPRIGKQIERCSEVANRGFKLSRELDSLKPRF